MEMAKMRKVKGIQNKKCKWLHKATSFVSDASKDEDDRRQKPILGKPYTHFKNNQLYIRR
jgi:hypothetical protein